MPTSIRPLAVLLVAFPFLACGLSDDERIAVEDNTFHFYNSLVRGDLKDAAHLLGRVEASLVASGMTPEAALDAFEAHLDQRCTLFERTSPTTARFHGRHTPVPDGCRYAYGFGDHFLRFSRAPQGDLVLELDVTLLSTQVDWQFRRVFPSGGGTPQFEFKSHLGSLQRALDFQGTALIELTPDNALQRLVLDGTGTGTFQGATEQKSWRFQLETLELVEGSCRPPQGRFVLEDFDGAGEDIAACDVALTFASAELKVSIDDSTETQQWTEARCACGRSGCHSGPGYPYFPAF